MTTPKSRALILTWAAASLCALVPAADGGQRNVKAYTTDNNKGGVLTAQITWTPQGNGTYKGKIQGRYDGVPVLVES